MSPPYKSLSVSTGIRTAIQLERGSDSPAAFSLDIDIQIPGTGVTAIFGQSGSGKTSLLRAIAGLERGAKCDVSINGKCWQNSHTVIPTHQRSLGYVFQESSLFEHLTAAANLDYAVKRSQRQSNQTTYDEVVSVMGVSHLLSRFPAQLSGGEKQRIAIARAMLTQPDILLMDEPLASLDQALKEEILPFLVRLKSSSNVPILYVSHSVDEVARLADYIVVLDKGSVVAQGEAKSVFSQIDVKSPLQSDAGVLIEGSLSERDEKWGLALIRFDGGDLWVSDDGDDIGKNVRIRVFAKDVSLSLAPDNQSSILNRVYAKIIDIYPANKPSNSLVKLKAGKSVLVAQVTNRSIALLNLTSGLDVWAQIKSVAIVR